jgi:hypothetical protein
MRATPSLTSRTSPTSSACRSSSYRSISPSSTFLISLARSWVSTEAMVPSNVNSILRAPGRRSGRATARPRRRVRGASGRSAAGRRAQQAPAQLRDRDAAEEPSRIWSPTRITTPPISAGSTGRWGSPSCRAALERCDDLARACGVRLAREDDRRRARGRALVHQRAVLLAISAQERAGASRPPPAGSAGRARGRGPEGGAQRPLLRLGSTRGVSRNSRTSGSRSSSSATSSSARPNSSTVGLAAVPLRQREQRLGVVAGDDRRAHRLRPRRTRSARPRAHLAEVLAHEAAVVLVVQVALDQLARRRRSRARPPRRALLQRALELLAMSRRARSSISCCSRRASASISSRIRSPAVRPRRPAPAPARGSPPAPALLLEQRLRLLAVARRGEQARGSAARAPRRRRGSAGRRTSRGRQDDHEDDDRPEHQPALGVSRAARPLGREAGVASARSRSQAAGAAISSSWFRVNDRVERIGGRRSPRRRPAGASPAPRSRPGSGTSPPARTASRPRSAPRE